MKKKLVLIGVVISSIFTLSNCTQEMDAPVTDETGVPFEFCANVITRTANDGMGTDWVAGDAVNLFHAVAGTTEYVADSSFSISEDGLEDGRFTGTLSQKLNAESHDWYAFYPYNSAYKTPAATSSVEITVGSAAGALQTQTGNDNLAHIAGINYPISGVAKSVPTAQPLNIRLSHLVALVELKVTNDKEEENLLVNSASITAEENLVGTYSIDFTGESAVFTPVHAGKTAALKVTSPVAIAPGQSACFYIGLKPFTAPAGSKLTLNVNGFEKEVVLESDITFNSGKIRTVNFSYDNTAAPVVTMDKVAYSSAVVNWTPDGSATAYKVYVNGQEKAEVASTESSYTLTGLDFGTKYEVAVQAVGTRVSVKSEPVSFNTLNLWVLDKSRHHVTIQWEETTVTPLTGTSAGLNRGYEIGVYTDEACTDAHYTMYPVDIYSDSNSNVSYVFGNSSWIGKSNNVNMMVPTKLSLGYLDENTQYYIRVRAIDGVEYKGKTMTNAAGTTEWSKPIAVKTLGARVSESNEVIFQDFDALCWMADRKNGCPGTLIEGKMYNGSVAGKTVNASVMATYHQTIDVYGPFTKGKGTNNEYYNGPWLNWNNAGSSHNANNYIGNPGTELEGWHFSSGVTANMGIVTMQRYRNRYVGTPALTNNLSADKETPCLLTFDMGQTSTTMKPFNIDIIRLRNGERTVIKSITLNGKTKKAYVSTDYEVDYSMDQYAIPIGLKSGDAVVIYGQNMDCYINMTFDNFKIVVDESLSLTGVPELNYTGWTDVTDTYKTENSLQLSSAVKIYTNNNINGTEGNLGYLMTIPAGEIGMKVMERYQLGGDENTKISDVVRANRTYSIFFPLQAAMVWNLEGLDNIDKDPDSYYSPLAYSAGKVWRSSCWNGDVNKTMYAPALAVKNGKAMISNAHADKNANTIYRYSDASGNGKEDWSDVDCAVGGYFMIVKGGQNLIPDGDYVSYSKAWRTYPGYDGNKCLLSNDALPSWKLQKVTSHDELRIARHAIGVTAQGDLVLFSVKKYMNTHNQGQGDHSDMNGASTDVLGVTLAELAKIMTDLGCSEAMTIEDANWSSFMLQNGGDRGHDLYMVNRRYTFSSGAMRPESDEIVNAVVTCFR